MDSAVPNINILLSLLLLSYCKNGSPRNVGWYCTGMTKLAISAGIGRGTSAPCLCRRIVRVMVIW